MKDVLVVDDDDSYIYLIERQLRSVDKNIHVSTCSSGKEALDYLASAGRDHGVPDVVILDLNMPVMGGFDFLAAYESLCISQDHPVPPPHIWIVTSSNTESDREKAHHFRSACGYLVKPLGKKELAGMMVGT